MAKSKGLSGTEIAIFIIAVISVAALVFYFNEKRRPLQTLQTLQTLQSLQPTVQVQSLPKAKQNQVAETAVTAATPAQVKAQLSAIIRRDDDVAKKLKSFLGTCRFQTAGQGDPLMPLSVYLHLVHATPMYLLLPTIHSNCFDVATKNRFKIVQYDATADWTFDYLGDMTSNLKFIKKIPGYPEVVAGGPEKLREFGFASRGALTDYLAYLGAGAETELNIYRVLSALPANVRQPVCGFDFYPGLQSTGSTLNPNAFKISIRAGNNSSSNEGLVVRIPGVVPQDLSAPSLLAGLKLPPEVEKLPRDRAIQLVAHDREDLQAVNVGTLLKMSGFQTVYFVPEGERGLAQEKVLTPAEVTGVPVASTGRSLMSEPP